MKFSTKIAVSAFVVVVGELKLSVDEIGVVFRVMNSVVFEAGKNLVVEFRGAFVVMPVILDEFSSNIVVCVLETVV